MLALTDLTVEANEGANFRRELLRWREVVAGLYVLPGSDEALRRQASRVLRLFTPESARQIPLLESTRRS